MSTLLQIISTILPYERLRIETDLSPEAVQQKLANGIKPHTLFESQPFWGKYESKYFKIALTRNEDNDFLPVIIVKIDSERDKTIIDITIREDLGVIIFMIFFVGVFIYFCLSVWHGILLTFIQ